VIESEPLRFTLLKKGIEQPIVVDPVTGDDFISEQEARGSVPITGQISGDVVDAEVTITFAESEKEFKAEILDDGQWKTEVPGSILAKEAGFAVTLDVPANDLTQNKGTRFTKPKALSVERRGRQYNPAFDPEYPVGQPDYSPPASAIPSAPSGQSPAFKPNY
jgi:hypothetical protein